MQENKIQRKNELKSPIIQNFLKFSNVLFPKTKLKLMAVQMQMII